jgi:hypothetical protein
MVFAGRDVETGIDRKILGSDSLAKRRVHHGSRLRATVHRYALRHQGSLPRRLSPPQERTQLFRQLRSVRRFDLIFGASRLGLKIIEVPIRYVNRTYGETQISRFRHGLLLPRMVWFAFLRIKAP